MANPQFVIDHDKKTLTVDGKELPWLLAESGPWISGANDPEKSPVLYLPVIEGEFVEVGSRDG